MEVDNETQSVVDYAIADQEFMAIVPAVYQGALITYGTGAQSGPNVLGCDTLAFYSGTRDTSDFSSNPVYIFNPSAQNCALTMPDGKVRSGSVRVRLTGKVRIPESRMIFKLNNYIAGGIQYFCDSMIVTTKESTPQYAIFNVKLVNGVCKTSGYSISYRFDRTFIVYPKGDANGSGAVMYIHGSASGTNRHGTNFSTTVSPGFMLTKHKTCSYIDRGAMELTPEGFKIRTIDFGNGNCDDQATFTVNENTVAFKLK